MRAICLNFQVHQPLRLKKYNFFQIGNEDYYFDDLQNSYILKRIAERCYIPMNNLLLELIKKHGKNFKVSFSISGTALEQFAKYQPEVINSFKKLAKTGNVEFLAETYYHSLASLNNEEEFKNQVNEHIEAIKYHLDYSPISFRNTEMIYSDKIGAMVEEMGFDTMLTEGAKHILGWKSPNFLYCNAKNPRLKLLLRNYKLSDDIAFRFSNKSWCEWPLTSEKFVSWINQIPKKEEIVNIFLDYETFGEHQLAETGIFNFMKAFPNAILKNSDFTFTTPSEASEKLQPVSSVNVDNPISWADEERDITAWLGNDLQKDAYEQIYEIEKYLKLDKNQRLIRIWRNLQTSDHFYYMSTKWFSDGDVHKYFNPYGTPYEAYINYMNVLSDFTLRLTKEEGIINVTKTEKKEVITKIVDKQPIKRKPGRPKGNSPNIDKKPIKKNSKVSIKSFQDVNLISDIELRKYLRTINTDIIFAAIQGADEIIKDKFLSNISKRSLLAYEILVEDNKDKFSNVKVLSARKEIIKPFLIKIISL